MISRFAYSPFFFFFQAEDGIRDKLVTGVQTCALPIWPMNESPRPAFARDTVHHVGDIVAAVIGETRYAAEDGAEAVAVEYEPLPAVVSTRAAVAANAPLVHPEFGSNLVF